MMNKLVMTIGFIAGPIMVLCSILYRLSLGKNRWSLLFFGLCAIAFEVYLVSIDRNLRSSLLVLFLIISYFSGPILICLSLFFLRKRKGLFVLLFVLGVVLSILAHRSYIELKQSEMADPRYQYIPSLKGAGE